MTKTEIRISSLLQHEIGENSMNKNIVKGEGVHGVRGLVAQHPRVNTRFMSNREKKKPKDVLGGIPQGLP